MLRLERSVHADGRTAFSRAVAFQHAHSKLTGPGVHGRFLQLLRAPLLAPEKIFIVSGIDLNPTTADFEDAAEWTDATAIGSLLAHSVTTPASVDAPMLATWNTSASDFYTGAAAHADASVRSAMPDLTIPTSTASFEPEM